VSVLKACPQRGNKEGKLAAAVAETLWNEATKSDDAWQSRLKQEAQTGGGRLD